MIGRILKIATFITLSIQLYGCASQPPSEQDQYRDLRGSAKYKAYSKVSDEVVRSSVNLYKKKHDGDTNLTEAHVHGLLGITWVMLDKPVYALANGRLALENREDIEDEYIARSLLALGMYSKQWHQLADDQSNQAHLIISSNDLSQRYINSLMLVHFAGTVLAFKEGDFEGATVAFSKFSQISGQKEMLEIADAMSYIQSGNTGKALEILNRYKENKEISPQDKRDINKTIKALQKPPEQRDPEFLFHLASFVNRYMLRTNPVIVIVVEQLPKPIRKEIWDMLV